MYGAVALWGMHGACVASSIACGSALIAVCWRALVGVSAYGGPGGGVAFMALCCVAMLASRCVRSFARSSWGMSAGHWPPCVGRAPSPPCVCSERVAYLRGTLVRSVVSSSGCAWEWLAVRGARLAEMDVAVSSAGVGAVNLSLRMRRRRSSEGEGERDARLTSGGGPCRGASAVGSGAVVAACAGEACAVPPTSIMCGGPGGLTSLIGATADQNAAGGRYLGRCLAHRGDRSCGPRRARVPCLCQACLCLCPWRRPCRCALRCRYL